MAPSPQFLRSIRLMREEIPTFDAYPFSLPAVRELFELSFHPAITSWSGRTALVSRPSSRQSPLLMTDEGGPPEGE